MLFFVPISLSGQDSNAAASPPDDLFFKIFKSRPQKVQMAFDAFLDNEKIGSVEAVFQEKINLLSLVENLEYYLVPEFIAKINKLKTHKGFVDVKNLEDLGIEVNFQYSNLGIYIKVPLKFKKARKLGKHTKKYVHQPNVEDASFSGMLGARWFHTASHSRNSDMFLLSPALNLEGVVLEGEASFYKSQKAFKYHRNYTSLIYDEDNFRFRAGDVFGKYDGYFYMPRILGVNLKKNAASSGLGDFYNEIPITLLRTSTVEVYINDNLVQTKKNITPGVYLLEDIPYIYGQNDVKIKVIDDAGREEYFDTNLFLDSSFLNKDQYTYDLYYGMPEINDKKRYQTSDSIFGGRFKYGLFYSLEASLGVVHNKFSRITDFGLRHKNFLGLFEGKIAFNHTKNKKNGKIFSLLYSSPGMPILKSRFSFSLGYEKNRNFLFLNVREQSTSFSRYVYDFQDVKKSSNFRFSTYLANFFECDLGFQYYLKDFSQNRRNKNYTFNLSRQLWINGDFLSHGYITASYEKEKTFDHRSFRYFCLGFSFYLKNNVSISSRFRGHKKSVNISKDVAEEGFGYNIFMNKNKTYKSASIDTKYLHNRFEADLGYSKSNKSAGVTRIGLESNLLFADGHFALSKQNISDEGFLIVDSDSPKYEVKMKNRKARSGALGGAVINTYKDYNSSLAVDLEEIPDDVTVKPDTLYYTGKYKKGAYAKIKFSKNFIAIGYLKDRNLKPIAFVGGETSSENESILFFTDDEGKFVIYNLKPGKYKLEFNMEGINSFEIEIPDTENNIVNLRDFVCEDYDVD